MAMILEVLHPSGTRTWHRLGDRAVTVGRGLANDLILDDPYVDARHARIRVDASGTPLIEDLGSVNGLVANDVRLSGGVTVCPGTEIRVGHTMLRFRDADEPVAAALVDSPRPSRRPVVTDDVRLSRPTRARAVATVGRWVGTPLGGLAIATVAVTAIALHSWLGSSERSSTSGALIAALRFAALTSVWSGIWAAASRVSVQRFHFVGHLAVASLVTLGALAWTMAAEWLSFFFPDASLADVLSIAIGVFLLSALVAGHLSLASGMSPKRQWRTGFAVAGAALLIGGLVTLTEEDSFSDIPTFSGVVKPVAAEWVPTASVDEFGGVMAKLKEQVDEMAKQ